MDHMQGYERLFRATKAYRKLKYSVIGEIIKEINVNFTDTFRK